MRRLLMGNQAIAMAALEAGVNVACGYPGTPSTEIIETIAQNNPEGRVHVEWSCNEKAAMELAAGVSYSGGRVIVTCKQVGMNVASDPFMCLSYVGARGGVVVVVADDPGPISSQTEQDSRQFAQFAHVPVLDPATPEEAYLMTKAAFELSEAHGLPVILRPTTRVDHGCASIEVADDPAALPRHQIPGFEKSPEFVIFPSLSRAAHKRMTSELEAIAQEFASSPFNKIDEHIRDDYELYLGIACSGDCRGYVFEALGRLEQAARAQGCELPSYRLLQVGTPHPFPARLGRDFLLGLSDALVVEELEPVVERSLLQMTGPVAADAYIMSCPTSIHGRLDHTTPIEGEYSCDALIPIIAEFLGVPELAQQALPPACDEPPSDLVPPRPAVLCAGCPHRASFTAIKAAAAGKKVVYAGDIGCYTLGCAKPLQTTDTCLCMGAGVTLAQGLQTAAHLKGDDDTLHVGFVGDSTFFASAMTGLANAVYNRHRMVLCVLDNATTAMTGSQPHPGTGVTLMGPVSKPISIVEVCRALGCDMVRAVDPFDREAAIAAAREALACEGVAVIVFQSPCVQLYRGLEPACVTDACRACGRCVRQTGCPALSMAPACEGTRGPAVIDPALCYGCDLCLEFCPFDAIETPRKGMSPHEVDAMRRGRPVDSAKTSTTLDCLVVGVGGQGVVLASRLIAWASMAGGAFVRTAETIGMSQRGGSVASHVRVAPTAEELPSSLIGRRGADVLLCFEPGEALRSLSQLKPGGALVCANRPIAAAATGATCDLARQTAWLEQHVSEGRFLMVDASLLEREGLSPKSLNVLLLGAAVGLGALPFGADELRRAMEGLMRPKLVPMNVKALELGMSLTEKR